MASLSEKFGDKLAILAFPSGEFGGQELATDKEIAEFAESKDFPKPPRGFLFTKGKVNGDDARSAWKFMKEQTGAADPGWNFKGKFLVAPDGTVSDAANEGDSLATAIDELM
mmetsp:Transcript_61801/g.170074  ORF Transcript_61801/g.170074 Transcript_61801/m.170074 type:complete len:112 (+) Transcript_61801:332-667(+)